MDERVASSMFSTSAFSRPVFTDTASTNCCLVICSSVPAMARYRSTRIASNRRNVMPDFRRRLSSSFSRASRTPTGKLAISLRSRSRSREGKAKRTGMTYRAGGPRRPDAVVSGLFAYAVHFSRYPRVIFRVILALGLHDMDWNGIAKLRPNRQT